MKGFLIIDSERNTLKVDCLDPVLGELCSMSNKKRSYIKKHETNKKLYEEVREFINDPEVEHEAN